MALTRSRLGIRAVTGTDTMTAYDNVVTASGDNYTITLPSAANQGQRVVIQKTDGLGANGITIARAGSDTIGNGGATSVKLQTQDETYVLVANGTNKWIIAEHKTDTPWITYTPTITGTTADPTKGSGFTLVGRWRRVGDSAEIVITYEQSNAGSAGTGVYLFSMPSNMTMDTNKITINQSTRGAGLCGVSASGTSSAFPGYTVPYSSTAFAMANEDSGVLAFIGSTRHAMNGGSCSYALNAKVPISGWEA